MSSPTITGLAPVQAIGNLINTPFLGVTVLDPNPAGLDVLTITIGNNGADGLLSGLGLSGGANGVYTLTGLAATITAELDLLVFTPGLGVKSAGVLLNDVNLLTGDVVNAATTLLNPGAETNGILLQDGAGQATVWEMTGTDKTGGGAVSGSPGLGWRAVGFGDFGGAGDGDILWQNTSTGQVSVAEMQGNVQTGGGVVNVTPGSAWTAVGTGDFNGDGLSDILWQNSSTGQVSIWEMNGNTKTGGGRVNINPGPQWKAVGSGDFNGDGKADILWQNTITNQVSIWEMDGNTRIGGGPVSLQTGPGWKAVGTGDFNHDGKADILWQNTATNQVSVWELDGTNVIGSGKVANPGGGWEALGSGAGGTDILLQNSFTGQLKIWEMNGSAIAGGGDVSIDRDELGKRIPAACPVECAGDIKSARSFAHLGVLWPDRQ
jgi:hypothetical protein